MSDQNTGGTSETDGTEGVRIEVTLPAPFAEVWKWVRDPALVNRWHGWEADSLADEIQFMFIDHAEADEEARTLQIGNHLFSFETRGSDTVVRLTRAAPSLDREWSDEYYEMVEHGWTVFLQQLRFALARHRDEERRTVFLYGRLLQRALTSDALDLSTVAAQEPGSRYVTTLPTGDELEGEVWFVTDHELGLTVDSWGDGLLIVATEQEDDPGGPRSMAVLTTYGKDDTEVEAIRQRWTQWWATTHKAEELTSS